MPNIFAYVMLVIWPLVAINCYKRFDTIPATFITIVGGYLLLPVKVGIDFPLIPELDKSSIAGISALIGCVFVKKIPLSLVPTNRLQLFLFALLVISPFFTVLTNQQPVYSGEGWRPGLSLFDSISAMLEQYIRILPFIIGLQIIKSEKDFLTICKLFVISGLIYAFPILLEVRISPQLHTWIYGFFPHNFAQQVRFDGFRPVVFLGHGLLVGIYIMVAFAFSCLLWKRNIKIHPSLPPLLVMMFLFFILVISKAVGAIVFGLLVMIAVLFFNKFLKITMTYFIFLFVIFYPALCIFNLFPHQEIIEYVTTLDADRAQSLDFRFYHEALLLDHARDKILFGWGGWGRNRLAGSITDGRWIIEFGVYGIIGFVALFGLICTTIINGIRASRTLVNNHQINMILITALVFSILLLDQIVNSSLSVWLWFLVGSFQGLVQEFNKSNLNRSVLP